VQQHLLRPRANVEFASIILLEVWPVSSETSST
jgi:hypothetical protein